MTVTVKNKTKAPLVVPLSVRRKAGHQNGEDLEFRVSGRVITILPKLPTAEGGYTPGQRRIINARLAKADEDIRAGRVFGPFNTSEEMAASVEANIKKLRATQRKAKPAR
jgi:bifunctional DNA-binding transcriptional regulator/antitoxin component of YhaV-PrlF toxin-antitoxin module